MADAWREPGSAAAHWDRGATLAFRHYVWDQGKAVYIRSGVKHALRNTGAEDLVMVFTYAPAGEVAHWKEELAGRLK